MTNATKITVWQDTGAGMVQIGTKTTGIVNGNNNVTVSGLVKGGKIAATQTVGGVDGCQPQAGFGLQVGGGANPKLRLALSIRESDTNGPAGSNGGLGANIHFIPATSVLTPGGAPGDGTISITPSTGWQTVTITGREGIASASNAAGTPAPFVASGYNANDSVLIQVYAYRTIPATGIQVFSATPAQSTAVISNDVFVVNWTWNTVAGADGYRLLRSVNSSAYDSFVDVVAANSFLDDNSTWGGGSTVTPTLGQSMPSVMWNPTVTYPDTIATTWGVVEAIALTSDDPTDNGPFNIYIDDLANGTNGVFQDFEGFVAGTIAGAVFNAPSYSGTTSSFMMGSPNDATIVNEAAYSGTKSQRVQWQFATGATNSWIRFNTYQTTAMPNPVVNLDQPISFKILVEPVGSTPTPPARPALKANRVSSQTVLSWVGAHNLQSAVTVNGTYTNVINTAVAPYTNNVIVAPYTNNLPEAQRFFRLVN